MAQKEVAPGIFVDVPDPEPDSEGDPFSTGNGDSADPDFKFPDHEPFFDPDDWQNNLATQLGNDFMNAAVAAGYQPEDMAGMFSGNFDNLLKRINEELFSPGFGMDPGALQEYYTQTPEGWQRLMSFGTQFYGALNSDLTPFFGSKAPGSGGGGGARRLTPQQIRDSYDLDQLTARADDVKRGLVLEGFKDPRGVARAYVDKIVAGKGEVKIDFDTFVETQVKETARFKSIFRNLPPGMNPRQYIAPLYQQAVQSAPREAEARAIGAAQFGASAQQFQARLNRTDAVTGSSPFINKMQGRLSQLKGVLKG